MSSVCSHGGAANTVVIVPIFHRKQIDYQLFAVQISLVGL